MAQRKALWVNPEVVDFDQKLDFSSIRRFAELAFVHGAQSNQIAREAAQAKCDVLITKEIGLPKSVVEQLNAVRLICEAGTGYNNIALDALVERKEPLIVCNVPGYSTSAVAQLTLSYVLGIASGTLGFVRRVSRRDRSDFDGAPRTPFEVHGKVLGVVGPGTIGGRVVELARAHGMRVLTYSRTPRSWEDRGVRATELEPLLRESDFVSLHCPLVEDGPDPTKHIIDGEALSLMQNTAWLINTSRGRLVCEPDLIHALNEGQIAGAALDVQDPEPPVEQSPLWGLESVYLSPHSGWKAIEARQRLIDDVASVIRAFNEESPINVVARTSIDRT